MKDIVEHLQPEVVIMENVEGLRSMLNGKVEELIIEDYKRIGYEVNLTVLNSVNYGVPQYRKRVIFIGNRVGKTNYHPKPMYDESNNITLGESIKEYLFIPEDKSINHEFTKHSLEMQERLAAIPEGKSLYKNYSDAWKKSPWDKPSCTIKENHGGTNVHPRLPRCLTARELATLQSFPPDFIFSGSKKWQLVQIGNAVPPLMGKAIGLAVKIMLDK
jgi:DNA (cytosine-5)-methyltransferase 1